MLSASTPLDEFRYLKRGSSASLSQVEDSVMRTSSPASLARMDLSSPRSINSSPSFTPDETSLFATLPRAKHKIGKISKKVHQYIAKTSGNMCLPWTLYFGLGWYCYNDNGLFWTCYSLLEVLKIHLHCILLMFI